MLGWGLEVQDYSLSLSPALFTMLNLCQRLEKITTHWESAHFRMCKDSMHQSFNPMLRSLGILSAWVVHSGSGGAILRSLT